MLTTTFALLRQNDACEEGYDKVAEGLGGPETYGDDTPIPILSILESNGLDDCLWALRAVPADQAKDRDRLARLFACDCAERVLPIFAAKYPDDARPQMSIEVARRYAEGQATDEERAAAGAAAWAAAGDAAGAAAWDAAWAAARAAAGDAAGAAAWAAARAAAGAAAGAAARAAETSAQADLLRGYLTAKEVVTC